MVERTSAARWARPAFYERFNDIDVYVEDSSKETRKLFAKLLTAALGNAVRLDCVFPLGSKREVLSACERDQQDGGRVRVYVVDGDLELCECSGVPALRRLYRLPRYCVENFLIDERAVTVVLARESEELDEELVAQGLDFGAWLDANARPLRRLFLAFAATKSIAPDVPTVSQGYRSLVSDASGFVDPIKVEAAICDLRITVDGSGSRGDFDRQYEKFEYEHRMKSDSEFMLHYVSGKHYLLPLLRLRMNVVVRIQKSLGLLKVNLAECVSPSELSDILTVAC